MTSLLNFLSALINLIATLIRIYPQLPADCRRLLLSSKGLKYLTSMHFITADELMAAGYCNETKCIITSGSMSVSPFRKIGIAALMAFGLPYVLFFPCLILFLCIGNLYYLSRICKRHAASRCKQRLYLIQQLLGCISCSFAAFYVLIALLWIGLTVRNVLILSAMVTLILIYVTELLNPFSTSAKAFRQNKEVVYTVDAYINMLIPFVLLIAGCISLAL